MPAPRPLFAALNIRARNLSSVNVAALSIVPSFRSPFIARTALRSFAESLSCIGTFFGQPPESSCQSMTFCAMRAASAVLRNLSSRCAA